MTKPKKHRLCQWTIYANFAFYEWKSCKQHTQRQHNGEVSLPHYPSRKVMPPDWLVLVWRQESLGDRLTEELSCLGFLHPPAKVNCWNIFILAFDWLFDLRYTLLFANDKKVTLGLPAELFHLPRFLTCLSYYTSALFSIVCRNDLNWKYQTYHFRSLSQEILKLGDISFRSSSDDSISDTAAFFLRRRGASRAQSRR